MGWIEKNLAKVSMVMAAALILLALFGWHEWRATRTARTEASLAAGQAGAALASGQDAVNTIGNRMEADAATDTVTRENDYAIRTAPGAAAPVDPALRDAALRGLCRRAAYRHDAKCVQHADPR